MNTAHHSAVDKAMMHACDLSLEIGAVLGTLSLAMRTNEFDPCQHAIICAEAMLPSILDRLEEMEVSLRAMASEMRAGAGPKEAAA